MASTDDVKKLAALARIELKDAELEKFANEFEGVLAYVGQIESLKTGRTGKEAPPIRNVFREDGEPHEKGAYTKKIVEQFPDKQGDALKVAQVISYE